MKTSFVKNLWLTAVVVAMTTGGQLDAQAEVGIGVWTNRYDGSVYWDVVTALAVDGSDNLFVTGYSIGATRSEYATIKYSGDGLPLWIQRYRGPLDYYDTATALALDGSGNVFVTGSASGSGDRSDYATIKYSTDGLLLWTNRYNGPGNGDDLGAAVAVDGDGNVFVTGSSFGVGTFWDFATIKYSGDGLPLWTNRYNGPGNSNDIVAAIAVDVSGDVLVTGSSVGSDGFPDFVTIKYSGAGVPLWTNRYDGSINEEDQPHAMAVDSSGNVFVTGYSFGATSPYDYDYVTVAYSGTGVPLWTNRYDGPINGPDHATSVTVDGNDDVIVTGDSFGIEGFVNYTTIKYSGDGIPLWTNSYNGPGNSDDEATTVAVDNGGNVFVTGNSYSDNGFSDFATIKYSPAGLPLWTNRYNGLGNRSDQAAAVVADSSGNVFVGGPSDGSNGYADYAIIKYASVEEPPVEVPTSFFEWAIRVAGTDYTDFEPGHALAIDNQTNLYMTGWFDGVNDFGNGVMLTNSPGFGQDIYLAKYNSQGEIEWARAAGGNSSELDGGRGIAVDGAGNVYMTGEFFGTAQFGPTNITTLDHKAFFLAKYNAAGTLLWVRQSLGGNPMNGPGWRDGVYGTGLAVDGAGNSVAVGFAANVTANGTVITFGTNALNNTLPDGASTFLVKYDNAGTALWARSFNSPEQCYSTAVTLDGAGNIYVAGEFKVSVTIGTTTFTNSGEKDGFVAKFNNAGVFQWARQMSADSDAAVMGVAADASGNVCVAGGFGNVGGDTISFGSSITLTNLGGGLGGSGVGDAFLAKYDALTGTPRWAVRAGGTSGDAYTGVSIDSKGNIYVGGGASGTGLPDGFNAIVSKYDSNGTLQWTQSSLASDGALVFGGPVLDAGDNSYVAGWFHNSATFGTNTVGGPNYWNYFLAKVGIPSISLLIERSNSAPELTINGVAGTRFVLEYVPTLTSTNHWAALLTNTLAASVFVHADTNSIGSETRFYRARVLP